MNPALVGVSRRLAYILRHHPESHGIVLDAAGWVAVPTLLAALGRYGKPVTRAQLDEVVRTNDKRRFQVETRDGADWIRAAQGHSSRVGIDLGLTPVIPPAILFHGTSATAERSIVEGGLRPGSRHHVHLSGDEETAWTVAGRRRATAVLFAVDAAAMVAAGHLFYRSANGVWLVDAVPPGFLSAVRTKEP